MNTILPPLSQLHDLSCFEKTSNTSPLLALSQLRDLSCFEKMKDEKHHQDTIEIEIDDEPVVQHSRVKPITTNLMKIGVVVIIAAISYFITTL